MNKRILIVEDDESAAAAFEEALSRTGYAIDRAETAVEAVCKVRELRPDLLLIDISLPDGSGTLLARTLGLAHGVPVIIMTALPAFSLEESLSVNPYVKCVIFKPCSIRVLLHAVEEALSEPIQIR